MGALPGAELPFATSRRGSRSTGHGEDAQPGSLPSVTDDVTEGTGGGGNGLHAPLLTTSVDFATWRRSLAAAAEHPGGGGLGAAAAVGGSMLRSPVRIRSSDPVGFADAVTAARMNVSTMQHRVCRAPPAAPPPPPPPRAGASR
jgi:hypothetical protein